MDKLVSVIIPVYNTEAFLQRCINTLVSQTYPNIELLFVNDGSTDNSDQILKEAEEKYPFVKVIRQENQGPSAARNAGLTIAKGEYIMFCDSDDEVEPQWIELLANAIESNPDSWVICDISFSGQEKEADYTLTEIQILEKDKYYQVFKEGLTGSPCNKIYRKDYIKNYKLCFDTGLKLGEDVLFNLAYFEHVENIVFIGRKLYHYYNTPKSLTAEDLYGESALTIYPVRRRYISHSFLLEYDNHYWYILLHTLVDMPKKPLAKRRNASRRIINSEVFQSLLDICGRQEMHPVAYQMLKIKFLQGFKIIQYFSSLRNKHRR